MILFLIPKEVDGCVYHRIEIPMHRLTQFNEVSCTTVLDGLEDERLKDMSLVVMSRDSCIDNVPKQIARLRRLGIPYILDLDDYWKLNKEHLSYEGFKQETAERWIQLMKGAAAVTTTTSRLAGKIKFHNPNVVVIPNALDLSQPQWMKGRNENLEQVFGWVGGTHHLSDIEILKPTFAQIHKENLIHLALGGWTITNDVYKVYEHWFTGGNYKKYQRIQGTNVYKYGHIYDRMEVCLVPLLESPFTACKSPLKLIEAGFKGKASIVSRCAPYTDEFTDKECLFVDRYGWYDAIMKLHKNPNLSFDYGKALEEKVQQFEIKKINPIREQLFTSVINGTKHS